MMLGTICALVRIAHGAGDAGYHVAQVDPAARLFALQSVDGRHGLYLCDGRIHDGAYFRVFVGMLAQQPGYALKMVFDAMVNFPYHGIAQTHRVVCRVEIMGLMQ